MMIWRFRRLIAAYGADPARWPPGQRGRAEALLARSDKARTLLAEAQAFDALLLADAKPPADEQMAAAIIARMIDGPQERAPVIAPARVVALEWSLSRLWPQAVGLAAAAVLGLVVGWADLLPGNFGGEAIDLRSRRRRHRRRRAAAMTTRRWFTVLGAALVVSLALNSSSSASSPVRLSGRGGPDWQLTPDRLRVGIERVLRALPDNDATIVRELFETQRPDITQRFLALQDARRAIGATLKAEPFDPAAFTAAYEAMQARSQELQGSIHGVIKAAIPQLSPEGRAVIVERRWRK
jgi:Spy/CpxP family protein refolding chaperone